MVEVGALALGNGPNQLPLTPASLSREAAGVEEKRGEEPEQRCVSQRRTPSTSGPLPCSATSCSSLAFASHRHSSGRFEFPQ
jgi:hypothetical protein